MRQSIFTLFAATLLLWATGCSNDESAQENSYAQESNNGKGVVATFQNEEPTIGTTRTTLTHEVGKGAVIYWTPGDRVFVEDDNGNFYLSNEATRPDGSAIKGDKSKEDRDATFSFPNGSYNKPSHKIRYTGTGTNGKSPDKVTIAGTQTQDAPNNADHIGRDGDCGVAVAKGQKRTYKFTLQHKVSYLCFTPFIENTELAKNVYLSKIVVTSNKNIAGNYGFNDNGLVGEGSLKQITLVTKGNGLVQGPWDKATNSKKSVAAPGFPISNSTSITNAAYMVIAPGTHTLKIEYYIEDPTTEVKGVVTKTLALKEFKENRVYDISTNLTPKDYTTDSKYYEWDAQLDYWGPFTNTALLNGQNDPQYPHPGNRRWYSEANPPSVASNLCKNCPNINEVLWYVHKGDPHWDSNTLWSNMQHLYKGGMWIKKKQHIAGYNANNYAGYDYRPLEASKKWEYWTDQYFTNRAITYSTPANTSEYFYLPALGHYYRGTKHACGGGGRYWTSSPQFIEYNVKGEKVINAAYLDFYATLIRVNSSWREYGFNLWTAQ